MPELPEVETIKNRLIPQVKGGHFVRIALLWPSVVRYPSPNEFHSRLVGQTVKDIRRRGKYLIFHISENRKLILHLKMTGILLLQLSRAEPEPYTRAIFHLNSGVCIHFRDRRKLGAMWLVENEMDIIGKLGPEPLGKNFTPEVLGEIINRHNMPIKALLLDQNIIAGIGNMYADEALFAARIHPLKKARGLSKEEIEQLHKSIRKVLIAAISHGGASVDTYYHPNGEQGMAQFFFQVAHRGNKPCYSCKTNIKRIPVRGRGTYFCPVCQGSKL